MIRAYWNALRIGDDVRVHDDADQGFAISAGTVTSVDSRPGSNGVTIRITDDDGATTLVRPKRLAVHFRERDASADCWRCDWSSRSQGTESRSNG